MVLYWFFFVVFAISGFYNWKRTVIAWIPFSMLFNEGVCLKYSSPAISLQLAVDVFLLFMSLVKKDKSFSNVNKSYFFKSSFIAYLISYSFSMIFSIVPFQDVMFGTIKFFVEGFVIIYLLQLALNNKDDISLFVKCLFLSLLLITIIGVIESVYKINPVLTFVYLNAPSPDLLDGKLYFNPLELENDYDLRYGMRRAYSFFNIHIAYGCACSLWYFMSLYLIKFSKRQNKIILYFMIPLCISGMFLSNSKTPMIGLLFFSIAFFRYRQFISIKNLIVLGTIFILLTYFMPQYLNNLSALFDKKMAEEAGGSNPNMRARQYEIALKLFFQNPIFGNGLGSTAVMIKSAANSDLLGSESSWLKILPQQGLIGAWAYLHMYISTFKRLKRKIGFRIPLCFLGGIFTMEVATGFMKFSLWGAIVIVMLKTSELYKESHG